MSRPPLEEAHWSTCIRYGVWRWSPWPRSARSRPSWCSLRSADARTGALQQNRDKARAIAAEIAGLDAEIGAAVNEYSRATRALDAVRRQIRENQRQQRLAYKELGLARDTLAARAVAMYKHENVTAMDAVFGAADLERPGHAAHHGAHARALATETCCAPSRRPSASSPTGRRRWPPTRRHTRGWSRRCRAGLTTIRARLDERRAALSGVRSDIRRLVADAAEKSPDPTPTVEPPQQGGGGDDGSGPWWPLIQSAAASNGVSARGMYRLMMIESGGSATSSARAATTACSSTLPRPGRAAGTRGGRRGITDGAAQIKATALAIRQGYGHAWWDPSYTWAFQGD